MDILSKKKRPKQHFKASGSADVKSHEFSFGFEFEQRKDSYWQFNALKDVWGLNASTS